MLTLTKQQIFDLEFKYPEVNSLGKGHLNRFSPSENWYEDETIWTHILDNHPKLMTEDFLEEFKDYLNWYIIGRDYKLSEDFMKRNRNYFCWMDVLLYGRYPLSKSFIEDMSDYFKGLITKGYLKKEVIEYAQNRKDMYV